MNTILDDIDIDSNHLNVLYPNLNDTETSKYYDSNSFNELNINSNKDLVLLNLNIRSLSANYDLFQGFLNLFNKQFGIISLTESWLNNDNKQLFKLSGYNDFHSLRNDGRRGGGLSMFISEKYNAKPIHKYSISLPFIETLFVEISKENSKVLIIAVYRPPKADINQFLDKFINLINDSALKYDEIILTGDFNVNLYNYETDNNASNFINTLASHSLIPIITKPTRVTDNSASIIDNIFLSNPSNFTSGVIVADISDHFPVFVIKHNFLIQQDKNQNVNISFRVINETTINNLCESLESCDFSTFIDQDDCSLSLDNLTNIINDSYKSCCPLKNKTLSYKDYKKPWITDGIIKYIKQRQNFYILYRKRLISKEYYSKFRNFVTFKIRIAKKKYFEHKFNSVKSDIKKTWKLINNILNSKRKKQVSIKKIVENGAIHSDPISICNSFNNFFVDVGRNIAESVKSNPNDHLKFLSDVNIPNSFFFQPVSPREIFHTINSLKNKSSSIDEFSTKILKSISHIINHPLSDIINSSFSSQCFPNSLKLARVIPIFKDGDKSKVNNYRPISILPILSKIFEKVAYKQLYTYLENNSILNPNQFGFRSGKSTTQAILNLMQYLYTNIDSNKIIFSMFLDFRKAFDSVDHKILLSKLNCYGIRGEALDWFRSYLSDRKQYVHINNASSNIKLIKYGVPQGSILGPFLFLIFINDITKCSDFFKFILYADDSTLSTCIDDKDIKQCSKLINRELNKVNQWLKANSILINEDKTKYMLLSYNKDIKLPTIKIGKNKIQRTSVTKFLGIHLDQNLTFKTHINEISRKTSKTAGLLYKLRSFLPSNVLKTIYQSLMHPYFIYGIETWHGTFQNYTNKIFIIQKKAIRTINNLEYNAHTNDYFKSNEILKLEDQYRLQTVTYIYKVLNSNIDPSIYSKLCRNSDIHQHYTKSNNKFKIMRVNRSRSKNIICHNGILFWNTIPEQIKESKSLFKFKKMVKSFYLNKY